MPRISSYAAKAVLAALDLFIVSDSAASNATKTVSFESLRAQTDFDFLMGQALGSTILAQTIPRDVVAAGGNMVSQTIELMAVYLPKGATITGVKTFMITQGVYTANNYNGVGLYSYNAGTLTLVASSTNDGTIWQAAASTLITKAFTTPYVAVAGVYFIALMYSSSAQTTAPSLARGNVVPVSGFGGADLTNNAKIVSTQTGQTALPSPTAAASSFTNGANTIHRWAGIY